MTSPFSREVTVSIAGLALGTNVMFEANEAEAAERAVLDTVEALEPGGLLVLDFDGIRVSSEAARQLLRRVLQRIRGGELSDRYLVVSKLGGSSRYNVEVMLQGEQLVCVERTSSPAGARLLGQVETALEQTFMALLARPMATANDLQGDLGLNSTQATTNRLAALTKSGLARRVTERPLKGGGREFIYAAVH
jgi:hypothetical protein